MNGRTARRWGLALAGSLWVAAVSAQGTDEVRFVSCPIYRDTDAGKKSGCWLADQHESGQRYDISEAPSKPDWNYTVLVEGRASAQQANPCGGVVLDPVRVSILPEPCPRHMLPPEGFPGRRYVLPARHINALGVERPQPPKPWTDRTFSLVFDWDRSFGIYQMDDYLLDVAITYIRAVHPRRVVVTGYAATTPALVSGQTLAERAGVARERAEMVGESLRRLGVDPKIMVVQWHTEAAPRPVEGADGLVEPSRRRADIDVTL